MATTARKRQQPQTDRCVTCLGKWCLFWQLRNLHPFSVHVPDGVYSVLPVSTAYWHAFASPRAHVYWVTTFS